MSNSHVVFIQYLFVGQEQFAEQLAMQLLVLVPQLVSTFEQLEFKHAVL